MSQQKLLNMTDRQTDRTKSHSSALSANGSIKQDNSMPEATRFRSWTITLVHLLCNPLFFADGISDRTGLFLDTDSSVANSSARCAALHQAGLDTHLNVMQCNIPAYAGVICGETMDDLQRVLPLTTGCRKMRNIWEWNGMDTSYIQILYIQETFPLTFSWCVSSQVKKCKTGTPMSCKSSRSCKCMAFHIVLSQDQTKMD
jgi:hypothetical protein